MKKRLLAGAMAVASIAALLAGCGGSGSSQAAGDATANTASAEGQVINIYSWNDEFRTRLEAVYPEVDHTSDDGTVTYLKDGTEIHWVINPNQDGVYQQKLDEALLNQATAAADENIQIAPLSAYDQGCVELIQNSFSDYFQGNVDFDRAKENFETAIKERYPDITDVQWPE